MKSATKKLSSEIAQTISVKIEAVAAGSKKIKKSIEKAAAKLAKKVAKFEKETAKAKAKEDKKLATYINNEIVNNADMKNRGVKKANYYVIKNMMIPSVLVELGFISNSDDRAKLINDKYVEIFADSIYQGIIDYYGN